MSDISNQLQTDREAVLLLYLADEMAVEDRGELERMLSEDAALRQDLERVAALQSEVIGRMSELDAGRPLRMSEDVSSRRVMREMRRFGLELKNRAPVQLEASTVRRWPRWIYPVGAAAAIIFTVLGLWGFGFIDFQPYLAEQDRSHMPHYDGGDFPMYRDQMAQERLQLILLASFGVEEDHPAELEESEDPATLGEAG